MIVNLYLFEKDNILFFKYFYKIQTDHEADILNEPSRLKQRNILINYFNFYAASGGEFNS